MQFSNFTNGFKSLVSGKLLSLFVRIFILILAYSFIANKLNESDFKLFFATLNGLQLSDYLLFTIILLFAFFNWSLETIKWKTLIRSLEKLSFFRAFQAVLSGVSVSIFTPNRVGEWGGRVWILQPQNRAKAVTATLVGSFSQLLSTLLFGILALGIYSQQNPKPTFLNQYFAWNTLFLLFLFAGMLLFFYFKIAFLEKIIHKIHFLKPLYKAVSILKQFAPSLLLKTLIFSLLRYFVFFTQFYFLLLIFDVQVSVLEAFIAIAFTYFSMAFIPSISLAEIGIRASVSLFYLGWYSTNEPGIVGASLALWLVNLALPAVVGSLFLIKA